MMSMDIGDGRAQESGMTTPIVQPPLLRQMFPATKAARQFSPWQVAPWCEALIAMLNRKMPARFTLTKDGDWALDIHVEINPPALPEGPPTESPDHGQQDTHLPNE